MSSLPDLVPPYESLARNERSESNGSSRAWRPAQVLSTRRFWARARILIGRRSQETPTKPWTALDNSSNKLKVRIVGVGQVAAVKFRLGQAIAVAKERQNGSASFVCSPQSGPHVLDFHGAILPDSENTRKLRNKNPGNPSGKPGFLGVRVSSVLKAWIPAWSLRLAGGASFSTP